jgi:glycosyltransferase involved in cell wall biosynthesis
MSADARSAVLHVTAANGGGVDRYLRDLAANTPRAHYAWHVGSGMNVLEDLVAKRFYPLTKDVDGARVESSLVRWLRATGIGIVHMHGVDEACRARLALLERIGSTPWIVTLHDLTFINPHAFDVAGVPEPVLPWIDELAATLRRASAVIVPSQFIRDLALRHLPGIDVQLVAPGLQASAPSLAVAAPADFEAQRPHHVVAVVGAIGPHKGSELLQALVTRLEGTGIGVVVLGYTDTAITRGWRVPGACYVYGPYLDEDLRSALAAVGAEVALFTNRMPESFSYTLSEVWAASIPVVVPDEGALGERVAKSGGGWRLPPRYGAAEAADFLRMLFSSDRAAERVRVKSGIDARDPVRIPSLAAMSKEIDALYQRFGLPDVSNGRDANAAQDALEPLLAANLDGFAFRKELIRLASEIAELKTALAQASPSTAKLEREIAEAQSWVRKLERDIDALKADGKRQFEENRRLADDKAAFDQLPLLVRKFLLKRVFRARG